MSLTKKQKAINKKQRHMQTKSYKNKLARTEKRKKFAAWSIAVRARDGNKCVICGDTKLVHAHHLIAREIIASAFDIDNGISLCPKHHKYSFEISAHKNSFIFMLWLKQNRIVQIDSLIEKYAGVYEHVVHH